MADERPILTEALGLLIESLPGVARIDRATSAPDMLRALLEGQYSAAVFCLDGFREVDGFSLCGDIKGLAVGTELVVLVREATSSSVAGALEAGARAVVSLASSPEELAEAVRAAAAGQRYLPHDLAMVLLEGSEARATAEKLSAREREALALAAGGLSNPEIAAKMFVSASTVKRDLASAFKALDARDRVEACAKARELGIVTDRD